MSAAHRGSLMESDIVVLGYCVHCRTRRQMHGAIQVCNRRGRHDLKGHCAVCGKSMYRLGGWDSVVTTQEQRTEDNSSPAVDRMGAEISADIVLTIPEA